jgi:hypothetical protein
MAEIRTNPLFFTYIIEFVNEILSVYCRFVLSDYCQQMTPKLSGSRFRVQARPDATGCGYEIIFTFYGLGFPLPHLDITGLASGSKVTTDGYCSQY